jgi:hypothetical protein
MAIALLSYFSTMVAVFAALMFSLATVFSSAAVHHTRPAPYRMSATARAMALERTAAIAIKQPEIAQVEVPVSNSLVVHQASSELVNDRRMRMASAKQMQSQASEARTTGKS